MADNDIVVFQLASRHESKCSECGGELRKGNLYSKRIGRTAAAKDFDPTAIDLAVRAYIRHRHTEYDRLLGKGSERERARAAVRSEIETVLARWRG